MKIGENGLPVRHRVPTPEKLIGTGTVNEKGTLLTSMKRGKLVKKSSVFRNKYIPRLCTSVQASLKGTETQQPSHQQPTIQFTKKVVSIYPLVVFNSIIVIHLVPTLYLSLLLHHHIVRLIYTLNATLTLAVTVPSSPTPGNLYSSILIYGLQTDL